MFGREPALTIGLVQALLALLVSFGLKLTAEQIGAILALAAAVLSIVTRQMVTPVAALKAQPAGGTPERKPETSLSSALASRKSEREP